jgi:hypothetical protein
MVGAAKALTAAAERFKKLRRLHRVEFMFD